MATDFRLQAEFPGHHKTRKMIDRLGTGIVYHWICLVAWSTRNRTDGDFYGLTVEDIEIHANWPTFKVKTGFYKGRESRGLLVETFFETGFFEHDDQGYKWHDWSEHQRWVVNEGARKEYARKAARVKWDSKKAKLEALTIAQSVLAHAERIAEEEGAHCAPKETALRKSGSRIAPSPSPSPTPSPTPKTKPSRDKREPDGRFVLTMKFIEGKCDLAHVPFVWEAREGAQLSQWLKAVPKLNQGQINQLISNRFKSKDPPGKRPSEWIPHLSSYATGPLDRFNKEPDDGKDYAADRERSIIESVGRFSGNGVDSPATRNPRISLGAEIGRLPSGNAGKPTVETHSSGAIDVLPPDGG